MANNNDALQQILRYETTLMHKILNMMVKLLTSFKNGITEVMSNQTIGAERVSSIIKDIDKITQEQQELNNSLQELEKQLMHQHSENTDFLNNLNNKILDKLNELNQNLFKVQKEMIESFNSLQDSQSKQMLDVIKQQMKLRAEESNKKIESEVDVKKEKIRQKFALWSAIAVGIVGGIFGIIQLILKLRG